MISVRCIAFAPREPPSALVLPPSGAGRLLIAISIKWAECTEVGNARATISGSGFLFCLKKTEMDEDAIDVDDA
jgi:hypothetical protein